MNGKRTAFPKFRLHGDFTAVQQGEVFYDCEAQSGASHVPRTRPVNAIEPLEKPFQMLRWNAVAVVCHHDAVAGS